MASAQKGFERRRARVERENERFLNMMIRDSDV